MNEIPHHTTEACMGWESKTDGILHENEEIFGEYPPVADIQAQMWEQLRTHLTEAESLDYMLQYFPTYQLPDAHLPEAS